MGYWIHLSPYFWKNTNKGQMRMLKTFEAIHDSLFPKTLFLRSMARGLETHQERLRQLALLGKDLTRRSGAKCELCGKAGAPLSIYEVPPAPQEPSLDYVLHLCDECRRQLEKPRLLNPNHWRGLTETIWSETSAVQVMATRILQRLAASEPWAREILDNAQLDPETAAWAAQEPLK